MERVLLIVLEDVSLASKVDECLGRVGFSFETGETRFDFVNPGFVERKISPLEARGDVDLRLVWIYNSVFENPLRFEERWPDLRIDSKHVGIEGAFDVLNAYATCVLKGKKYLRLSSFGYREGVPTDADIVLDCRHMPNPFWVPELRTLTGKDAEVKRWMEAQSDTNIAISMFTDYLNDYLMGTKRDAISVAFGCTGGQHRSVYAVETLGRVLGADTIVHLSQSGWKRS